MTSVTGETRAAGLRARVRPHLVTLMPGLLLVGLMLVWAIHDGGYDSETWYWGALASLSLLCGTVVAVGPRDLRRSRLIVASIALFALYVAWSYVSISWAAAPGTALDGSNKALMYLIVFTLMALLPWTSEALTVALLVFAIGVGAIAVVLLFRLASGTHVNDLFVAGRLAAPTGYINSTAALFTIDALLAIALATRRRLPGPLRGLLLALAAASLQTAIIVQSRGWLFTLPVVALFALWSVADRLRFAVMCIVPALAALIPIHRLLALYDDTSGASLRHASIQAGEAALLVLLGVFVVGTLVAWGDKLAAPVKLSRLVRTVLGSVLLAVAFGGGLGGLYVISDHHPVGFVKHELDGFSRPQLGAASHFEDVGTSRYDFWRVALLAFRSHPIGGLGQDNFRDFYYLHRHSTEEPESPHSLEMRLLACTGIVGTALFVGFFVLAVAAAVRARRRGPPEVRAAVGAALLALVVWTIHGSIDWFWEMPALSGPALGFLGAAASLSVPSTVPATASARARRTAPRVLIAGVCVLTVAVCIVVLGLPYLSSHETSIGVGVQARNPRAALSDLRLAAALDPLNPDPGTDAGTIALTTDQWSTAAKRFAQSISRERGAWFPWLGAGLAASELGETEIARHDLQHARGIDDQQPAITVALHRLTTRHPLSPQAAFSLLVAED